METFVPERAPMVILGFLGMCLALGLAGLVLLYALAAQKLALAKRTVAMAFALGGAYAGLLLAASLTSTEKTLGAGQWKYFCEVDCHLAYSVTGVSTAKTLGEGQNPATAEGTFYVVTIRTWFDEDTISRTRGDGILHPNLRTARIMDSRGRRYPPSLPGQLALQLPANKLIALDQPLRPGESYETTLVFDVPADAESPRLYLTDPLPVNWVLIGHENSFFHRRVYFGLEPRPAVGRASQL